MSFVSNISFSADVLFTTSDTRRTLEGSCLVGSHVWGGEPRIVRKARRNKLLFLHDCELSIAIVIFPGGEPSKLGLVVKTYVKLLLLFLSLLFHLPGIFSDPRNLLTKVPDNERSGQPLPDISLMPLPFLEVVSAVISADLDSVGRKHT